MSGAKPPPLRTRHRSSLPKVIIVAAISVVVIPVILFAVWRWHLSRDIDRLEAKARAAGEPITLQELAATRKPIPDDENAAVALMDIWQEEDPAFWKAFRAGEKKLPDQLKTSYDPNLPVLGKNSSKKTDILPWNENQLAAARAFVSTDEVRAKRIRESLSRPKAQFPLSLTDGYSMLMPHLASLRDEAKRLELVTLLAVTEKHPKLALSDLGELIRLSETMRDEPLLINQLVRISCIETAFTGIEQLLLYGAPNENQLQQISALLRTVDVRMAFHQGLLGERAFGISLFRKPINELGNEPGENSNDGESADSLPSGMTMNNSPINAFGFFSLDERLLLQTYDRLTDLSRDGNWNHIAKAPEVIREAEIAASKFPPKIMSKMALPAPKAAEKCVSVEARRRCALLAIEVVRFRQSHGGQLPDNLDSIVAKNPDLPATDPFDGKQLRYRILPDGFVVYSVGPDRTDQKGVSKAPKNNRSAYDVAFTVGTNDSN